MKVGTEEDCAERLIRTEEALGSDQSSEIMRWRSKAWRRRVEMYMGREYLMSRSKSMASERRSERISEVVMAFERLILLEI